MGMTHFTCTKKGHTSDVYPLFVAVKLKPEKSIYMPEAIQ